jgi:glycine/D-amino acid oxidase-like deaminating enzyme
MTPTTTTTPTTVDVAVIGAGIVGSTTAFFLARDTDLSVTLLEADAPACGASGGPGHRGVRANGRDPREIPLAAEAIGLWEQADELLGADSGYEQIGGLSLLEAGENTAKYESLQARATVQERAGVPTEILDQDAVRERLPGVSSAVQYAGWNPKDGIADHTHATRRFADAAVAHGARLETGARVERIEQTRTHAEVHLEDRRSVRARAVVVAANVGTKAIIEKSFGLTLPTWGENPQVAQVRLPEGVDFPHLVNHTSRPLSLKRAPGGLLTVTGGPTGLRDADGRGITNLASLSRSLEALAAVFPSFSVDTEVVSLDASRFDAYSADGVPIIDAVPGTGADGEGTVIFATGWTGHGFAIGPASGKNLARWVEAGERPGVFAPFAAARFGVHPESLGGRHG